jgi:cytochrome c5
LLVAAWPEISIETWSRASIGARDGWLLAMQEELFGSRLETTATCPNCGDRLEMSFDTQDVRIGPLALPPGQSLETPRPDTADWTSESIRVEAAGFEIQCRLPSSADLIEIAKSPDPGRATLLERCVQSARKGGRAVEPKNLPGEVVKAITEAMAKMDPQAEVLVALTCPACHHPWSTVFDIVGYLWSEIDDWARRLLSEVDVLASSYGWSESAILGMTARRRRLYLEIIGT